MSRERRQIIRSGATLRRLRTVARDAVKAVAAVEELADADIFGRLVLSRPLDEREVGEFLSLALEHYPDQELEVIVVAHERADATRSPQGKEADHDDDAAARRGTRGRDGARAGAR